MFKIENEYYAELYNEQTSKHYIGKSTDCINFEAIQELPTSYEVLGVSQLEDYVICLCGSPGDPDYTAKIYKISNTQIDVVDFDMALGTMAVVNDKIYVVSSGSIGYIVGDSILLYADDNINYSDIKSVNNSLIIFDEYTMLKNNGIEYLNKIANLENGSDMSFGLEVGRNVILKTYEGFGKITYRQKYIGV